MMPDIYREEVLCEKESNRYSASSSGTRVPSYIRESQERSAKRRDEEPPQSIRAHAERSLEREKTSVRQRRR